VALSFAVLDALRTPSSVEAVARRLAVPAPHVRSEIDRLARRGYVARQDEGGADAAIVCASAACGGCAFRTACGVAPEVLWARVPPGGHARAE
jgi:hypothetical protein